MKRRRTRWNWKKLGVTAASIVILAGLFPLDSMVLSAQAKQKVRSSAPVDFEASNIPNSPVKYSARTAFYDLFISSEEADVVLHGEKLPSNELTRGKLIVVEAYASLVRMRFIGSNLPATITPLNARDRSRPPYTAVDYRGIYPGTDVLLGTHQRQIGFELNLTSGAEAQNIVLELAGVTGIELDAAGNAIVNVGHASFVLQNPVVRINANGHRQLTSGAFKIEHGNRLRFIVPGNRSIDRETMGD